MKTSEEIFGLIINNIHQIIPFTDTNSIYRSSKLSPLGLDSIGRAELIEMILEDLGINLPRHEFHAANNLGELADCFAAKLVALGK